MNRRPTPPAVAVALSLLLIAGTAWLWIRHASEPPAPLPPPVRPALPSQSAAPPAADSPDRPATADLEATPEHAIPDERVVTFASEADYRQFVRSPHAAVRILSRSDSLLALRLQVPPGFDPSALPSSARTEYNYALLAPLPVAAETLARNRAFGQSALSFLNPFASADTAGHGVTVAVLDTGIRSHSSLDPDRLEQIGRSDPDDYLSHGTAVASLVAGKDGTGIAPQAKLIGIQVLDTDGIGDAFSLAEAIVQAVDAKANIINMSLGSYGTNQALANAVAYADAQGVVLVASAGNEGVSVLPYPAAFPSVIAVSAIDADGHPTSFANQSAAIDIAAPGVGVYAAWEDDKWIGFTGTSASTPYVSGSIAALSSALDIPAAEAARLLLANANDSGLPGRDPQLGRGYVDLRRSHQANTTYTDLALADIYLSPQPDYPDRYTLHLTAQNRGTQVIPAASLSYTLPNGITQDVYLGALEPGDTGSHSLTLAGGELQTPDGYRVSATAEGSNPAADAHQENDSREAVLYPIDNTPTP